MSKQYPGGVISKTPVVPTSLSAPGIWTLNQQAAAQNTNTWPFPRDPQFNYVTMLLHGDGSAQALPTTGVGAGASSTVTAFNTDASTNNFNITINGDARSDNFTPYQTNGYYGVSFNGSSDFLTTPQTTSLNIGTGTFTVEAWVYLNSKYSSGGTSIINLGNGANGGGPYTGWGLIIDYDAGGSTAYPAWYRYDGSVTQYTSSQSLNTNQWYHLAVARDSSNNIAIWVNGTRVYSGTSTVSYNNVNSDPLNIGKRTNGSGNSPNWLNGYLSNGRVVIGSNVYDPTQSTITVPTSPLTAVTNTQLLILQSNRFIDNSSAARVITSAGGAPAVSPAQPFTLPSSVATYGSGYFDGTGDWLQTPSNSAFNFSATDCTLEFWYYGAGASGLVFEFGSSTPDTAAMQCEFSSGTLTFKPIGASSSFFAIQTNAWNYIAAVKTGTTYYLYINGTRNTSSTGTAASSGQIINIGARNGGSTAPITGYLSNFRVSNTARYTGATMTVPTTILSTDANTQLLITQYNGGGNNSGFKDSSQFNFPITRNGNTTQGTFTPYGSNWSNYFGGSDYITLSSAPISATGAFTFECWVFVTGTAASQNIYGQYLGANAGRFGIFWNDVANKFTFSIATGSYDSASTYTANTWYHIAWVRDGSDNLSLYVNGVRDFTTTGVSTSLYTGNPIIAARAGGAVPYTGYISNLRITNTAVYSGTSFTVPTTPLTNISGTTLLTCQSNRFVDNETTPLTFTITGTPSVQRFSPFAPLTVYNPATTGGSAYFDGTGDWLSVVSTPQFDFGTGNFTLECWAWSNNFSSDYRLIAKVANISSFGSWQILIDTSGYPRFYASSAASSWDVASNVGGGVAIVANTWNHIAVTRSGTTFTIWVNGVSSGTTTSSASIYYSSSVTVTVGGMPDGTRILPGYITDARILKGTAQYTSAFTPNTTPLTATTSTVLLTNMTNPAILDNSMLNNLETVGNAAVSTSVKKYGSASMVFDGTGDYLVPNAPSSNVTLGLGAGDFTVEFWVYFNSGLGSDIVLYDGRPLSTNGAYPTIYVNSSSQLSYVVSSSDRITSSSAFSTLTWYHVALARSGTSTKMFVNGTQVGSTYTDSTTYLSAARRPTIAINGFNETAAPLNGYLDDLRVTKGYARYTANFTAPTAAFPNG